MSGNNCLAEKKCQEVPFCKTGHNYNYTDWLFNCSGHPDSQQAAEIMVYPRLIA